ncbi:MAG: AAA family ATPase, partial [Deltaproteobacteria bacterium]|nr:AAA family ATPase [Deltaproteobacteria bacterium]
MMFSTELAFTLEAAFREAVKRQHAFFCIEHLLYALLFDEQVIDILTNCGADIPSLRRDLEKFFETKVEKETADSQSTPIEPQQTPAVQRVLQRAILHAHSAKKEVVTANEMLVAVFSEEDSDAVHYLARQGVTRLDVMQYVSHGVSKLTSTDTDSGEPAVEMDEEGDGEPPARRMGLQHFTENLTEMAKKGELDPVIGREKELERALKILSRRQKNSPLFLGDPGVGKSAMANAVAQKIADGEVPASLEDATVLSLNIGSLIAGTKFRGEFEERIKLILSELAKIKNPILFIDEIHTIVGAGATGTGSMDVANLLKPALAGGKLRCIGSTTHEDF